MKLIKVINVFAKYMLAIICFSSVVSCEKIKLSQSNFSISNDRDHAYIFNKLNNSITVEQQVVDYKVVDDNLFILRMVAESIDCYDAERVPAIITHYSNVEEYWHINLSNDSKKGPFTKPLFISYLKELGDYDINLKISNSYVINTEYFKMEEKKCSFVK